MKSLLCAMLCVLTSIAILCVASPARADLRSYCEAYARDLADRKVQARAADPGGMAEPGFAVASLGQGTGDAIRLEKSWRRARNKALLGCIQQYEVQPVPAAVKPAARPAKVVPVVRNEVASADAKKEPSPGTDTRNKKCLAEHPTFNADTGMYTTWSGSLRKCR